MSRTTSIRLRPTANTFVEFIRQFVTPAVWKQGHRVPKGKKTQVPLGDSAAGHDVGAYDLELRRIAR
jgi:type IV secretory pathway VirD2 relaxase